MTYFSMSLTWIRYLGLIAPQEFTFPKVIFNSFSGVTFTAEVTFIADKAEFTPRNVQTAEGRRSTVFAVKLLIANPEGKLKPGMPADVKFER